MKLLLQFILLAITLLAQTAAAGEGTVPADVPAEAAARFAAAETYRTQDKLTLSYPIYAELAKNYPNSFSVIYGYGSILAQMQLFGESATILKTALALGTKQGQVPDPAIYNTLGWVATMNGDFDQALEHLGKAKRQELYSRLNETTRMKLHNNTGYALMLLDRYEEALQEFKLAERLGSEKAKLNIEKVESLIETQKKQDPNIPGVFAAVVFSLKNEAGIDRAVEEVSSRLRGILSEPELKLNVYRAKTGMYFITVGGNYSYRKAQEVHGRVRNAIPGAFVSSTTSWEPCRIGGGLVPPAANPPAAAPGTQP